MTQQRCGICGCARAKVKDAWDTSAYDVDCPRCGRYGISRHIADDRLDQISQIKPVALDALCHAVKSITKKMAHNRLFIINNDNFESIKRSARIRNPQEQLDNLVIWLGGVEDPSEFKIENREGILAIVGAPINSASYEYLIVNARERNLIDCRRSLDGSIEMPVELRLTLAGWERFATLQTIQSDSKNAFMAMKFDESTVAQAFEQCFKPAVADAGFTLSIATDIQKAGHVDDQMMVAIRTARFIIADSSDSNLGVYWEAGFAHGLGKPVFYTCREDVFDDPDRKPHFDIDHMVTIKWNLENLETARKELTARIRNTFPTEARLSDTG